MLDIRVFDTKKKEIKNIPFSAVSKHKKNLIWIDCVNITKEEADLLQKEFDLHPLTVEDLLNTGSIRVKVEEFSEHLFCVFYGLQEGGKLHEVDFVLGKNFLISNHKSELYLTKIFKENDARLQARISQGTDFLMHRILDSEVDNCFVVLEKLGEQLDGLEEKAASDPNKKLLSRIFALKRTTGQLRRTFLGQREKTGFLAKAGYTFISAKAVPYFRDIYDHSIHVSDALDNYREAVSNSFEVYMSAVSNNMNEVMKTLSVIATIALPLSVISGIYGTNFINLPGMHVANGFWYMLGGMFVLCVGMLGYFWKKKWF